jgi:hypothetical protein
MHNEKRNIYSKFYPNVYVAKCTEQHEKGEIIILTTKHDKEHENFVYNYLGKTKDGFYLYSITRADGFNHQERAKAKAEKLKGYASNADKRSAQAYEASQEAAEFLKLGEPIKIGHHSERRHRALIARNWARMGKSIEESNKAEDYRRRAEYWEGKTEDINLSQPESINFFEFKLEEAKRKHQFLKDNPEARPHNMSLKYANKEIKELKEKMNKAVILWGDPEDIEQLNKEKEEEARAKATKGRNSKKINFLINNLGGFFFFGSDVEKFKNKVQELRNAGKLEEDEKVFHVVAGLYMPHKHKEEILKAIY